MLYPRQNRLKGRCCEKCESRGGKGNPLTRHHILPKRHFKTTRFRPKVVTLCRECHNALEGIIRHLEGEKSGMLNPCTYFLVIVHFLVCEKEEGIADSTDKPVEKELVGSILHNHAQIQRRNGQLTNFLEGAVRHLVEDLGESNIWPLEKITSACQFSEAEHPTFQ